jgi:hypothetical protein
MALRCPFCTDSLPLYRRLGDLSQHQPGFALYVATPDPASEVEKYLKDHGVAAKGVFGATLRNLGIRATPTILIVKQSGIIEEAFVGFS